MENKDIIKCKVIGFQDYGMFVNCGEYDGLVHISEISDQYVDNIEQIFKLGDEICVTVLSINESDRRLKLSYKACHEINKKISKNVPIKIGFHSLNRMLPIWIEEKKKGNEEL